MAKQKSLPFDWELDDAELAARLKLIKLALQESEKWSAAAEEEAKPLERAAHHYLTVHRHYQRSGSYPRFISAENDGALTFFISNGYDYEDDFEIEIQSSDLIQAASELYAQDHPKVPSLAQSLHSPRRIAAK